MVKQAKSKKKNNLEKALCIIGYLLVPIFFIVMFLLMTMSYEDIFQANLNRDMGIGDILVNIYNYIPRLGEFYQRIAVHFMTFQTSFDLDLIFRLLSATMCWGLFYSMTVFILGRRPRLKYRDVIIYLLTFIALMVPAGSEVFTYRFSYVHNYVLAMLSAVLFLLPFRLKINSKKWYIVLPMLILGFFFGISTEITPLAFLMVLAVWIIFSFIKKRLHWRDFWTKYRVQLFLILGLAIGLIFFYAGGGLGSRISADSAYGKIYHYVSVTGIFSDPIYTVYNLLKHFWYNMRYLLAVIPLIGVIFLAEYAICKNKKIDQELSKRIISWQAFLALFCLIFLGATSQIAAHDDLLPRFIFPVTVAISTIVIMFVNYIIEGGYLTHKMLLAGGLITIIVSTVMLADMSLAFTRYHVNVQNELEYIHYTHDKEVKIDPFTSDDVSMSASPIFRYKQLSPFNWDTQYKYTKYGIGIDLP